MTSSSLQLTAYSLQPKFKFQNLIPVAVFLLLIASVCAAQNAEEADLFFAKKAFGDGLYELAETRLEEFLRDYPQTPSLYEAHALLGRCYYKENKFSRALYEFEAVLTAPAGSGSQDDALYWSGEIYLRNGDFNKALESYQRIIDEFGSSEYLSYALYSKGWAYYKIGLLDDAIKCFREAASKYSFEKVAMEAQFKVGECEYLLARYDSAEEELKKFINQFPVSERTAEAYYLAGEAEFFKADYKGAAASFNRALAVTPAAKWAPFAIYRKARSLFLLGDYGRSLDEYGKCRERADNDLLAAASLLGLARANEKLGFTEEAKRRYAGIIEKYPDSDAAAEAYYRKIKLLYDEAKYIEAEADCRLAIENFPKSEYIDELRYEMGWLCLERVRPAEAMQEFAWVEKESGDIDLRASALSKIGDIYLDAKEFSKAAESYDRILDNYADSAWADYAQYQIGNVFLASGKYDQALLAYQSVLVNFPETKLREKTAFRLGAAYFAKGDFERAAVEFGKVEKDSFGEKTQMLARYQTAWCYWRTGKESQALAAFSRFLKDYPAEDLAADVRFWFGEYYTSKGKYDKAREYFSSILKDFPSSGLAGEALYRLALNLEEEEKRAEAAARFEEVASRLPDSGLARRSYRKIAMLKKESRDFDAAIIYLKKAMTEENSEENAQAQYEIAECAEKKGDLALASEEYLKVPGLFSKGAFWSVRAELAAAKIFERTGRLDEAKSLYEKLAAMDVEESSFARQRIEWIRLREAK